MKLFLVLLLALSSVSLAWPQPNRHALLIGVGDYPSQSGWNKLNAKNDLRLLREALLAQGFKDEHIITLSDAAATKQGILEAIQRHLTAKVQPGDRAVFHFSGHGQQVQDDNGDEIDGLDEAIVPYDSPKYFVAGENEGQYLLRDDELGAALLKVRRTLGKEGHLLVLLDACHSGTGTRGRLTARGTDIIMASPDYLERVKAWPTDQSRTGNWPATEEGELAPMAALFSSSPNQLSYEYTDGESAYGLFTYAVTKALHERPTASTYRGLLERVGLELSAFTQLQTPQGEGQLDLLVFGEGLLSPLGYFTVREALSETMLLINGGTLQGVTAGSRIALYPPYVNDTLGVVPLCLGIVDETSPFDADLLLDSPLAADIAKSARVFIREQHYGPLKVAIEIILDDKMRQAELEAALSKFPFVEIAADDADLFLESPAGLAGQAELVLSQRDGSLLWQAAISDNWDSRQKAHQLFQLLAAYARANYLRKLQIDSRRFQASLRVLVRDRDDVYHPLQGQSLKLEDQVKLEVLNTGPEAFYFSLLDIQPDHKINNLCPGSRPAADFYLRPGASYTTKSFTIMEPVGTEVLKIIATAEPLELDFTHSQGKPFQIPLEELLSSLLLTAADTRGETPALPSEVGFIGSLVLTIKSE